jgi:hypothetical protein
MVKFELGDGGSVVPVPVPVEEPVVVPEVVNWVPVTPRIVRAVPL